MKYLDDLYEAILNGDSASALNAVNIALEEGQDPEEMVNDHMIPAMDEVGQLFETGEYFLPELLVAAGAMKDAMVPVRPLLAETNVQTIGRVITGTVQGDIHDIGKNLVGMMLEGAGFDVIDLGVDVPPAEFVRAVKDEGVNLVMLSALLTTTMPAMKRTIEAFEAEGIRDQVKILVGGAPVTEQFSQSIGADGTGKSSRQAVQLI